MSLVSKRLQRACRVCFDTESPGTTFDKECTILQLYKFCFDIVVAPEDYPRKICNVCITKINEFSKFKTKVHNSESLWKSNTVAFLPDDIRTVEVKHENQNVEGLFIVNPCEQDYNVTKFVTDDCSVEDEQRKFDDIKTSLKEKITFEDDENLVIKEEVSAVYSENGNSCSDIVMTKNHDVSIETGKKKRLERNCGSLSEAPIFNCGICDVTSLDSKQEKQHLTEHSSNNDLHCRLCDFVGRDFADTVTHRYDHHPKEYKVHLKCHLCAKRYFAKLALQFHYRSVHLKQKGGLCSQCGKQFGNYKMWRNHEKSHRAKNFECDLCGMKFLFRHTLKTHMINHSEVKGYVCDICGKGFKRNWNLKLHLQTAHDSSKVTCGHCNGTFKNQNGLKAHMKRLAKEKPFQCKVCLKYFGSPNMLNRHMIWHGDERPFVCNVCGSSYKSVSQLNTHMRKHTGVLPYKCGQCTKSYPTSNQLREHMSNHTGVRRYKCPYCPKSFHHKKVMVEHCSKRHSEFDDAVNKPTEAVNKPKEAVNTDL